MGLLRKKKAKVPYFSMSQHFAEYFMSKTKKDSKDSRAMRKYTPHKPKMTPYKRESKAQRFREDS